jgi:cold shock CspA family protein
MHGRVISIVPHYGFIRDDDGQSYYFNAKSMVDSSAFQSAVIGSRMEFEPQAGPKGMRATRVTAIEQVWGWSFPDEEFRIVPNRQELEGHHCVLSLYMATPYARHIGEVKNLLINSAKCNGANRLTDMQMESREFSEGNYRYTMHRWVGYAGLYMCPYGFDSQEHKEHHEAECEVYAKEVERCLEAANVALANAREEQDQVSLAFLWKWGVGIVFFMIFMAIFAR